MLDKFSKVCLIKYGVLDTDPPCHRCLDILVILESVATKMFSESWEEVKSFGDRCELYSGWSKIPTDNVAGVFTRSGRVWASVMMEEQHSFCQHSRTTTSDGSSKMFQCFTVHSRINCCSPSMKSTSNILKHSGANRRSWGAWMLSFMVARFDIWGAVVKLCLSICHNAFQNVLACTA